MKNLKKVLSVVIALLFLMNNLSMADVLNTGTLAPESRLSPLETHELLDFMKLTADIVATVSTAENKDLTKVERDTVHEIDKIEEGSSARKGDVLTFEFRNKLVFNDERIVVIPCYISGVNLGNKTPAERHYWCCARKTEEGDYEFEFFTEEDIKDQVRSKGITNAQHSDISGAIETITKKTRGEQQKGAIDRFVDQQNNTDRMISETIANGEEIRLDPDDVWVQHCGNLLAALGNKTLYKQFKQLVDIGQVMFIPGLKKPHAGGIGIYMPTKISYTQTVVIHETFAKCGFTDSECEDMEVIFYKLIQARRVNENATLSDVKDLSETEIRIVKKARQASFENRWNDPINIDYYKLAEAVADEEEMAEMALIERMKGSGKKWYLGIDSSTQSVTFTIIDIETGEVIYKHKEEFDDAYYVDKYGAEKGVLPHPHAPELYHTDPIMLAEALDRGMEQMSRDFKGREWDLYNVRAISGAGQQHGTVFYNKFAQKALEQLDPYKPLAQQLIDARILARDTSAIWQDGTTEDETKEMEELAKGLYGDKDEAIGAYGDTKTRREVPSEGPRVLRKLTGSAGTLRFGLAQIMAFFKRHKRAYDTADTILNIAAYNGSLLAGMARFPWDVGDAAGSNAMNIKTRKWMKRFIDKLAPGLSAKLPDILPSNSVVSTISSYWTERYGFNPKTKIVNWTGDNPSAMAGQGIIKKGQIAVSLGTSYTMYTFLNKKDLDRTLLSKYGHVFGEPTGRYMKLICFQNGALTLEEIRDKHILDSEAVAKLEELGNNDPTEEDIDAMKWHIFTGEIEKTKAGNDGAMMIAQHKTEDTPRIPLPDRAYTRNLDESNRAQVFRAAVEGQFYLMKWVADQVGLEVSDINLTGGVSVNPAIRQILADIFDATVNVLKDSDSVSLGSAIRAAKADHDADPDKPDLKWKDAIKGLTDTDKDKAVTPDAKNVAVYRGNFSDFVSLLETALGESETAPASTEYIGDQGITDYIKNVLDVPAEESMEMIEDMHSEMDKGLAGEKSSLQMIPTHSEPAVGDERGVVVTLDFGGSNFRVYLEEVRNGEIIQKEDEPYQLKTEHMEAESPEVLFDFLAQCISDFVDKYKIDKEKEIPISFIFSFPADQKSINCGIFKFWTKGFKVKGMKDKDVVKLLNDALARAGLLTTNVEALANDTVAAFQAGRYRHKDCDAGIIIATGTNGAIVLKIKDIPKYKGPGTASGEMVVNMEWGGYKVKRRTPYDLQVDEASADPGKYTFEKAISGKYLNEQAKAIFRDLISRKVLFGGQMYEAFREGAVEEEGKRFETIMMDNIIADTSYYNTGVAEVLKGLGIDSGRKETRDWRDRRLIKEICDLLITRSARLCATGIAAIVTYRDPNLERTHTVSIDGSLYQKCPGYGDKLRAALEEMFGKKASNIKIFTEKNMTGKGAAVISLVAKRVPDATTMDASAGEVVEQMKQANPVIFVPQHFITKYRCGQLAKEFPGATFVTFDQNANLDKLPDLLGRYPDRKKVVVGMGLDFGEIKDMIDKRPDDFGGVVPLNFSDEGVSGLQRDERKSLQRSVISIALLAGTLPDEGYEETYSYRTLRTLLDIVLPDGADIDTYMNNLLSADMDTGERFSYLINTMLRPIVPYDHKQLEYIVNFLVSA